MRSLAKNLTLWIAILSTLLSAEERTLTPEQMEKLANEGDFSDEAPERPANLPDLTKYEPIPGGKKSKPPVWTLGPTGIVTQMLNRKLKADQILVKGTLKGSPAEGKLLPGDVLLGINGRKFTADNHLGILIGNAIIESELPENGGRITFQVWRDKNYLARSARKDVAGVDIDELFQKARDDNSLYDWKPEEERTKEVVQMRFDDFPIDPETLEVELKLRTFPAYSDTAPYDCPKTMAILEDAWKVLEKKFIVDPEVKRSGRGGIVEAIALLASGKPEHRELVRQWVRGKHSPWKEPTEPIGAMFEPGYRGYKGYQSWHKGYAGLYCAIYYDATGDEFVLPALRKYAIETAMGQSALGSWGHTFSYPSFNGGKLHQMNPGYGALNAAGNRCFFLVTLAQHLGIKHPEIDLAVERGRRFFGSYTDQGCIPYGDHPAYGSDDSNGKNSGVAYSMKLLGDDYAAKYFAMMSSHCAFTRRGGHGHDYHGNWSSWAANLCGPDVRAYNERNLRWRRTLCRMFDGSFIYHSPTTDGYGPLRDPTATQVLHQSVIFKQTIITGKDPNESLYPNEREMKQLLTSARGQFQDPWLKQLDGTPWPERSTEEIISLFDIFYPKARANFAKELGKRHRAGEKEIVPRLLKLLENDEPRFRDGALRALGACGSDVVLGSLSKLTPLLKDPEDFVRITATREISKVTDSRETQLAMLEATLDEPKAIAPNSVRNSAQAALFNKDTPLANTPFDAGFDPEDVRKALEHLILLDPTRNTFMSSRSGPWSKDTIVRLAGPLTYAAEEEQVGDQMFANRSKPARALLDKFGYREGPESSAHRLRKQAAIPRDIRHLVGFKRPLMDAKTVESQPAAFTGFREELATVLTDKPNILLSGQKTPGEEVYLEDMFFRINAIKKPTDLPSIGGDVRVMVDAELAALNDREAKIRHCHTILEHSDGHDSFRKLAAMEALIDLDRPGAMEKLAPYFGHDDWRLREGSRDLAAKLADAGEIDTLVSLYGSASGFSAEVMAGLVDVFARAGDVKGRPIARQALQHESAVVRANALRTLATLGGPAVLNEIVSHLESSEARTECLGAEDALLILAEADDSAATVRDAIIRALPKSKAKARASAYFVLGRIGDAKSIETLRQAGKTNDITELRDVVLALSYSHSRSADQVLLEMARDHEIRAKVVAPHAVRRMVLGPDGFQDITDAERMEFAEPMLRINMDKSLMKYLSRVPHPRALRALMYCLENGVRDAAYDLVASAERIDTSACSREDSKVAVEALQGVIEYIEVTQLRGGVIGKSWKAYPKWKELQARAGRAMLRFHKPEEAPIPGFDPLSLVR